MPLHTQAGDTTAVATSRPSLISMPSPREPLHGATGHPRLPLDGRSPDTGLDPGLGRATAEPLLEEGGSLAAFVNGPLVSGLKRLEALEPCLAEKRPDRGPCVAKGLQYGVEQ